MHFYNIAPMCECPPGDSNECDPHWIDNGWQCPYQFRPRDIAVSPRDIIRITCPTARMWTGKHGDPTSEIYRRSDICGLEYIVEEVNRTRHYTQVKVICHDTHFPGWVNVWHRRRRCWGVRWAVVVPVTKRSAVDAQSASVRESFSLGARR